MQIRQNHLNGRKANPPLFSSWFALLSFTPVISLSLLLEMPNVLPPRLQGMVFLSLPPSADVLSVSLYSQLPSLVLLLEKNGKLYLSL